MVHKPFPARKPTLNRRRRHDQVAGILFVLPLLCAFIVFVLIPLLKSVFYFGFTKYGLMTQPKWIGLANFQRLFGGDPNAASMWGATLRIPLMLIPLHVGVSLAAAYLVYSCRNGIVRYITRTALYFPVLVTTGSIAVAWAAIFSTDNGPLNWALGALGILKDGERIPWLVQSQYAMWAIVIFSAWKFLGQYFLYYFVAMQNIPETFYEAARIDGAGGFQVFRRITLPLITPTMFFVLLIVLIGAMQAFDEPFFITGGGPGYYTTNATLYIYRKAFQSYDMGYASAIASVLFVFVFALTLIQLWLQNKWVVYDYE